MQNDSSCARYRFSSASHHLAHSYKSCKTSPVSMVKTLKTLMSGCVRHGREKEPNHNSHLGFISERVVLHISRSSEPAYAICSAGEYRIEETFHHNPSCMKIPFFTSHATPLKSHPWFHQSPDTVASMLFSSINSSSNSSASPRPCQRLYYP
jgi:hypothetical protein